MRPALTRYYYYGRGGGSEALPDVYAAYGTDFEDLLLPEGQTWQEGTYDPLTEGTYQLTSTGGQTVNVILEKYALKLDPSNLYTMLQEQSEGVTDVAADGDPVGTIYDIGKGMVWMGGTTSRVLASDPAFSTLISAGASEIPLFQFAHIDYWKSLNAANPNHCIRFVWRFDAGSDGVLKHLIFYRTGTGSTNFRGLQILRNADGTILFVCYKASSQRVYQHTTTQTVNEASGIVWVTININGVGADTGAIHIKTESGIDISETFAVNAGSDTGCSANFEILESSNQSLGALQILPRAATPEEITAWKTYNPARHSTPFLIKNRDFNPAVQANIFSDAAGTIMVTDGGNMRVVKDDVVSPFGELPGYTSADDLSAPLWTDNAGLSYALFNGVKFFQAVGRLIPEGSGKWTLFVVARNDDTVNGSHYLAGADGSDIYMVQVGVDYTGNPGVDKPYMVIHPDSGFTTNYESIDAFAGDNVFAVVHDKSSIKQWNNSLSAPHESTNSDGFPVQQIGRMGNGISDWALEGRIYRIIKYSGVMPEARALAIRDELKTTYGIV